VAARSVHSDTPERFANYDLIAVAYHSADLVAAVLALLVIDKITNAQRERRDESVIPR